MCYVDKWSLIFQNCNDEVFFIRKKKWGFQMQKFVTYRLLALFRFTIQPFFCFVFRNGVVLRVRILSLEACWKVKSLLELSVKIKFSNLFQLLILYRWTFVSSANLEFRFSYFILIRVVGMGVYKTSFAHLYCVFFFGSMFIVHGGNIFLDIIY